MFIVYLHATKITSNQINSTCIIVKPGFHYIVEIVVIQLATVLCRSRMDFDFYNNYNAIADVTTSGGASIGTWELGTGVECIIAKRVINPKRVLGGILEEILQNFEDL